jgi:hypothetical protein
MGKDKKEIRKPEIVCIAVILPPSFSILFFGGLSCCVKRSAKCASQLLVYMFEWTKKFFVEKLTLTRWRMPPCCFKRVPCEHLFRKIKSHLMEKK